MRQPNRLACFFACGAHRAGHLQKPYAPDKAKIGSISDLILSKDAKTVEGFVIGVGGFLGIGEKGVATRTGRARWASRPSDE